ncbi:hypothetical protein V8C86DRAFT_3139573 [Haematococcus lacustris]
MLPARKRAAAIRSVSAASLLGLSAPLLDDIASRAVQLGAGKALSLTCRAFSLAILQHAPALSIKLGQGRRSRLLAPRVISALQTRTCKLTLTLKQPRDQEFRQYMKELTTALVKLRNITAVHRCKLLQQLDLTGTTILQTDEDEEFEDPRQPEDIGAVALFQGLRLKQLSLEVHRKKLMPDLQPLAPHLTQLCIGLKWQREPIRALAPLLPRASVWGHEQLDALLAATQLTSIQLESISNHTSRRTHVPCSWQRLEVVKHIDCAAACCLPLYSLTQPLVLGKLYISAVGEYGDTDRDFVEPDNEDGDEFGDGVGDEDGACELVANALHNLLQACQVPVRIGTLSIAMGSMDAMSCVLSRFFGGAREGQVQARQLLSLLQPLGGRVGQVEVFMLHDLGVADVPALAQLCQGCTSLEFCDGSLTPQPGAWAQGLDITIEHTALDLPDECHEFNDCLGSHTPGRFRARYE